MKSLFKSAMLVAALATAFVSCSNDNGIENREIEPKMKLTLRAGNPEIAATDGSRTEMIGMTPYWSAGDRIAVSNGTSSNAAFTGNNQAAAKVVEFTGETTVTSTIYTYYPYNDTGIKTAGGMTGVRLSIPTNQAPTATSFDGSADLMIGRPVTLTEASTTVANLQFARIGGIVKVVLKDGSTGGKLAGQQVSTLSLTSSANDLTGGYVILDLKNNTLGTPYNVPSKTATADYTSATQYAIDGTNATYLGVYPGTLAAQSKLTVAASTKSYAISKEITLPQDVVILPGKITTLVINLGDDDVIANATGLALPFEDNFTDLSGTTTTDVTKRKNAAGDPLYSAGVTLYQYNEPNGLRFSTSSRDGYLTTVDLNLSQPFTVLFTAKSWGTNDVTGITVTAGETTSLNTPDLTTEFDTYLLRFDAQTSKTKITIKPSVSMKRMIVQELRIVAGHDIVLPAQLTLEADKVLMSYEAGDATVGYTIKNPVPEASVTAEVNNASENSWLTVDTSTAGTIKFTAAANSGNERTATVALSYPNAEPVTVAVTQSGHGEETLQPFDSGVFAENNKAGLTGSWNAFQANKGVQLTSTNGNVTWTKSDYTDRIKTVTVYASNNASKGNGTATVTVTDAGGTTTNLSCKGATSAKITGCGTTRTAFVFEAPADTELKGTVVVNVKASANSVYIERVIINE